MTYDDAWHILDMNQQGRYRGNSDRLRLAVEIAGGDVEEGPEDVETVYGVFELGGENHDRN